MSGDLRWAVLRDRWPFGVGTVIGTVHAPDHATAVRLAAAQYTGRILVQSVASRNCAVRELHLPARDPSRDAYGLKQRAGRWPHLHRRSKNS